MRVDRWSQVATLASDLWAGLVSRLYAYWPAERRRRAKYDRFIRTRAAFEHFRRVQQGLDKASGPM